MSHIRESVRGVITSDVDSVLLMHRIKNSNEYWVLPGGWIDEWEDAMTAFMREIQEEIGNIVLSDIRKMTTLENIIGDQKNIQHIFSAHHVSGDISGWTGPEFNERFSVDNYYKIEAIRKEIISTLNIVPPEAKDLILEVLVSK